MSGRGNKWRGQRKTGGGSLSSEATLRPISEKIVGIIGETSISGNEGGIDVLDSSTTRDALLASPSNMTNASKACPSSVENSRLSRKVTKRTVISESQQRDDLMTRLMTAKDERLSIEKRRLEIEERRLDTEEKRLKIEDRCNEE